MRHDPAFKRYFSLATVVEDLLRAFAAPNWAQSLDFSTLSDASPEFVDETLHARCGDMVWRVCFHHGTLADGTRRYLFVLLEFQSSVDTHMQWRMRRYTDALLERLMHNGVHTREGELPPVLPVVLYNGNEPWTAQGSAPPGWATRGHAEALPDRERRALARFRSQAYHLVDIAQWRCVVSHIPSWDPHGNGSDYSVDGFPGMTKQSGNRSERVRSPVARIVASQVLRMSSPERADACPSSPLGVGPVPP